MRRGAGGTREDVFAEDAPHGEQRFRRMEAEVMGTRRLVELQRKTVESPLVSHRGRYDSPLADLKSLAVLCCELRQGVRSRR